MDVIFPRMQPQRSRSFYQAAGGKWTTNLFSMCLITLFMTRTQSTFFCNWTNSGLCNNWPFCPSSWRGTKRAIWSLHVLTVCHVTPCPIILWCCQRKWGNEMPRGMWGCVWLLEVKGFKDVKVIESGKTCVWFCKV